MPNMLATPAQKCGLAKRNGEPCGAPRRAGFPYCMAHDPERTNVLRRALVVKAERERIDAGVIPDHPLQHLLSLDPSSAENLRVITIGLAQHIAAKSIDHQSASSILRFAKAAAELTPRRRDDGLKHMLSSLLSTKPVQETDEEDHVPDVSRETPPLPPGIE